MNMSRVPKLRFKEFSGEWEERPLEDIISIASGISPSNYSLNSDSGLPFIKVEDLNNCSKYQLNAREYSASSRNVIKSGSIIFPKRGAAILLNKIRISQCDILMDSNMMALTIKSENFSNEFLYYKILDEDLSKIADTSSIPQINNKHILPYKIFVPFVKEQQKIASFLSAVDTKIDQLTRKKELFEQYKKGVMQKIFSQELRFKADDGSEFPEWEEKKLGEMLDYLQPTNYLVDSTEYSDAYDTPVLTAGKTFILGYTNETKGIFRSPLPVIIFDDFTTDSKFVNFSFKAKSSAMKILTAKANFNIKFIYEAMQIIRYETGGHSRHWISVFAQMYIAVPTFEEQTKIASFLSAVDTKIDLVTKQLDVSKNFKKGLLQQMFV